jgi:transposase
VIDVFVEELDLGALGFAGVVPEATGRPAYHPGVLLKIYVYGYINQIASSRRLERETQRNVELMWLTGRLARAKSVRLPEKIAALREQMAPFKPLEPVVHAAPDQQVSLTDPDARSMATSGRGSGVVGYNVQAAVDATHHLIVAHEVTNTGHDRDQLSSMAGQGKAAMGLQALEVLADRGYFDGEEVLACEGIGVTPYVPKPLTSSSRAKGRFGKQDFIYLADEDVYRCPAGETLTRRFTSVEDGMNLYVY